MCKDTTIFWDKQIKKQKIFLKIKVESRMPYLYFVIHCLLTIDYLLLMRGMRS